MKKDELRQWYKRAEIYPYFVLLIIATEGIVWGSPKPFIVSAGCFIFILLFGGDIQRHLFSCFYPKVKEWDRYPLVCPVSVGLYDSQLRGSKNYINALFKVKWSCYYILILFYSIVYSILPLYG